MALICNDWQFDCLGEHYHLLKPYVLSYNRSQSLPYLAQSIPLSKATEFVNTLCQASPPTQVLQLAARSFNASFLHNGGDIHTLALALDVPDRLPLIEIYIRLISTTETIVSPVSSLCRAAASGSARLLAVFGGQGIQNPQCLDDLRTIHQVYGTYVDTFITYVASTLRDISIFSRYSSPGGIDLLDWLHFPEKAPGQSLVASAPISFPVNGLISLCHYCISCRTLGLEPGQMRDYFSGATGHSQGIVAAAVVAGSDSWESFYAIAADAIALLFWIGFKSQSKIQGPAFGSASRMLSIRGLTREVLDDILIKANAHFEDSEKVAIALVNSKKSLVVAGSHLALRGVQSLLEHMKAPPGLDQSKIVYTQRRPDIEYTFLPISAPFHSHSLSGLTGEVLPLLRTNSCANLRLGIPLYHTRTGLNLQTRCGWPLVRLLVSMVTTEVVNWTETCLQEGVTHIVDFGPSRTSTLLQDRIEGSGIRTILASEIVDSTLTYGGKHELFSNGPLFAPDNWSSLYRPAFEHIPGQSPTITNRFVRLFGTPPIMVAGMTPTTMSWDFVSSVINSGYHIELAAGGFAHHDDMEAAIRQLAASIPANRGIAINMIYANPRSMLWQTQLIARLISQGVPIDGITLGAGVPSPDVAAKYIETLGIKYIAFKPGSIRAIHDVIAIANKFTGFPIILQWTGGRAGGHHSYEDQFEPMLATYSLIRMCQNVTLVVGGGLGDAEGILPFFTGEWSTPFGYARMPFDGVLLGSRLMTAKEAHTSSRIKELITSIPGTSDGDWHKTYNGPAGGIITITSEMGEPIHTVANPAALLWKELDDTVFSNTDQQERNTKLQLRRGEIIHRLNQDYCRPWFAMNHTGSAVEIEDLSYLECLHRCVELMYLKDQGKWVHDSYRSFFLSLLSRMLENISISPGSSKDPLATVACLAELEPEAMRELLHPEVVEYFMSLCRRRGQKPVNFIPRLDADFETWFKKDSLWQAENLETVIGQDPRRVCIIHGPVAARYSKIVDEPAAQILGTIMLEVVGAIQSERSSAHTKTSNKFAGGILESGKHAGERMFSFDSSGTEGLKRALHDTIATAPEWLQACLLDTFVMQDHRRVMNPVPACLNFGPGDVLYVKYNSETKPSSISLLRQDPKGDCLFSALALESPDGKHVRATLEVPQSLCTQAGTRLQIDFRLVGGANLRVLVDETPDRGAMIRRFYSSCWGDNLSQYGDGISLLDQEFCGEEMTLTKEMCDDFITVIYKASEQVQEQSPSSVQVPIDIAIVIAWSALTKCLLVPQLGGELTRLLYRSNSFRACDGTEPLAIGDVVKTRARITRVDIQSSGKLVEAVATIYRRDERVVLVESSFFIPGQFPNDASMSATELSIHMHVDSLQVETLLRSRSWIKFRESSLSIRGQKLGFQLSSRLFRCHSEKNHDLLVTGQVFCGSRHIADIEFSAPTCIGNPVVDFLQRRGAPIPSKSLLESPGWESPGPFLLHIADLGFDYSIVSGDTNPIHTSQPFAAFAGLERPILHGMYTSAVCKRAVMQQIAASSNCVVHRWSTSFEGKVHGGDQLRVELQHTAMIQGKMIFEIRVFQHETNDKVLQAEIEVEQVGTAYVFCGQGSQVKGMGMSMYESDQVARGVWDQGDRHLFKLYGRSIIWSEYKLHAED